MKKINHVDNNLIRQVFRDKEVATSFLRDCLPPELLAWTDLSTVELEKKSHVNEELMETFIDLLFRAHIAGKKVYIYYLVERKSYQEEKIPLLLKYIMEFWEQKVHKEKGEKLPLILPMVLTNRGKVLTWADYSGVFQGVLN